MSNKSRFNTNILLRSLFCLLALVALPFASYSTNPADSEQFAEQPVKWNVRQVKISDNIYEIEMEAVIADNQWHTYDLGPYEGGPNATSVTLSLPSGVKSVGSPYIKKGGKKEFDKIFNMNVGLITNGDIIAQKVEVSSDTEQKVGVNIEWQACKDGSCIAPEDADFSVSLPPASKIADEQKNNKDAESEANITDNQTDKQDELNAENIESDSALNPAQSEDAQQTEGVGDAKSSIWKYILEAMAWGLLALFTPCVFPMLPMTVSFFLKQNEKSPGKGKFMALLYGISIVLIYTIPIAILILLTLFIGGENLTVDIFNWLATNWIPNIIFFIIFIVFALSFFGAFEITLPSKFVNSADNKSNKGGILGVFFMALTLVLVSFSCTGPIVSTALIKSTQGEIWTPIVVMLVFSFIFAIPFTFFAFAPSLLKNLKSGGWLNSVKVVLGFIELALGMKFLSVADQTYHWGILDREVYLAFWIVIFSLLGLYLLGKIQFKYDSPKEHISIARLLLSIITFAFVVYMIPGMWGAPLKALSGYLPPIQTQDFVVVNSNGADRNNINSSSTVVLSSNTQPAKYSDKLHLPHGLNGYFTFAEALEASKRENKPIFFDFTGHGCVNCREMEARVWSDPEVLKMLKEEFVICSLYGDDKMDVNPEDYITLESGKQLKSMGKINSKFVFDKFKVNAQPFYIVLDSNGNSLGNSMGYNLNVDEYKSFLKSGLANFRK